MKRLLPGILLCAGIMPSFAQQTLLTQNFEDPAAVQAQQWGGLDVDGDDLSFGLIQSQATLTQLGFSGNVMGSQNFYVDDNNNPVEIPDSDNMLVTPAVALPHADALTLSFRISGAGSTATAHSGYKVYVLTAAQLSGVTTTEGLITAVNAATPLVDDNMNGVSQILNVDISQFQGQTVIAFIRHSNSQGVTYLFVDDVSFTSGVLGLDHTLAASFALYPNPVNNLLIIQNPQNIKLEQITITDTLGKTVHSQLVSGDSDTTVNTDSLAVGTYFVAIKTEKGTTIKQVIKK